MKILKIKVLRIYLNSNLHIYKGVADEWNKPKSGINPHENYEKMQPNKEHGE